MSALGLEMDVHGFEMIRGCHQLLSPNPTPGPYLAVQHVVTAG